MGPPRLEPGLREPAKADTVTRRPTEYFYLGSAAAESIKAVIPGMKVSPEAPMAKQAAGPLSTDEFAAAHGTLEQLFPSLQSVTEGTEDQSVQNLREGSWLPQENGAQQK